MNTPKYLILATICIVLLVGCSKSDSNNALDAELAKLPPITSIGANTFGCLVNGKAYIPRGSDGQFPNFDVIPDPSDSSIDIRTYNMNFNGLKADIFFGGGGLYNGVIKPFGSKTRAKLGIYRINSCFITVHDTTFREGYLKLNKYDVSNGIFSGEFECTLIGDGCTDTVRITNGRFDKKM